ncbi:MAG: amidohydrolase family protein [Acidobacteria bacterium]|nr:amidohydrolase family protein [Acidobacteriota bacterium]
MRVLTLLLISGALLSAQNVTVIQNGIIHTVTKGTFQGSVVIRDGKITDVGEKVMTPPGAKIVDATGKHVMPGIIDAHTHIALDSINEMSLSVTSMVDMEDVVAPEQPSIYRALAGGVTTANTMHGSANSIGGQNVVFKMRWGQNADGLIFKQAPPSLKMALGENVKRSGNPSGFQMPGVGQQNLRYPGTRMGVEDVIREAYTRARAYQQEWKDYEARKARGETALPPRRDLQIEPLVEVLEGKRRVHAHCYRADEILMLMRVFDDFGIKNVTWQHVLEGYKVAKEMAARGDGASTFSDWWAYKVEAGAAIPYKAAIMQAKGVNVSINSDDAGGAELMRRLNTEAAKIMKYGGVSEDQALAMITINPARQLGIDKFVGSIEAGKDADIVIYDKNPLSIYSKVEKVFIDGKPYFDRDNDMTERPKKEAQKKGLLDKEKDSEKRNAPQMRRPS